MIVIVVVVVIVEIQKKDLGAMSFFNLDVNPTNNLLLVQEVSHGIADYRARDLEILTFTSRVP